ncbi:hypothetical protein [Salinibius halmophilus]|uniref:hypothetical protein n=1 Tax=Salinibius halmophilus TaxID=1853216 RepID=UPI000E67339B|nr:hypothetical protein [Salinibius halmophilus]
MKRFLFVVFALAGCDASIPNEAPNDPLQTPASSLEQYPKILAELSLASSVRADIFSASAPMGGCRYRAGTVKDCSDFATQNFTSVQSFPYLSSGAIEIVTYDQITHTFTRDGNNVHLSKNYVLQGATQASNVTVMALTNFSPQVNLQDTPIFSSLQCDQLSGCELPKAFNSGIAFGHGSHQVTANYSLTLDNSFSNFGDSSYPSLPIKLSFPCQTDLTCSLDRATGDITGNDDIVLGLATKQEVGLGYTIYTLPASVLTDTTHIVTQGDNTSFAFTDWHKDTTVMTGKAVLFNETAYNDVLRYFAEQK